MQKSARSTRRKVRNAALRQIQAHIVQCTTVLQYIKLRKPVKEAIHEDLGAIWEGIQGIIR